MAKRIKAEKTRNAGTMTEAMFWSFLRSNLRRAFRFWKPIVNAKIAARRPNQSDNKRLKWQYQCADCKQWFPDKEVEVDHVIPCGSLKSYDDLPNFVRNLTAEGDGAYRVLCIKCHQIRTNQQREERNNNGITTNPESTSE